MSEAPAPKPSAAVLAALRERRSVRAFTGEPVSRDHLLEILDAGRGAPNGLNNQPWRYLTVWPDSPHFRPRVERLADCTKYAPIVRAAAALICVLLKKDESYSAMKDHQGCGACVQNMLLAAHALGLGAVWLGQIVNDQDKVLAAVDLSPEVYEMQAVIALGVPAGRPKSSRKPLDALLIEPV